MKGNSLVKKSLILIVVLSMVLAGCSSAATTTAEPVQEEPTTAEVSAEEDVEQPTEVVEEEPVQEEAASTEKTTLTVASWWDFSSSPSLQDLKTAFEAANPDLEIDFIQVAADSYADKMLTTIAGGGDVPDVMMLAMDKLPMFADRGAVVNLDTYYSDELKSELYDSVLQAVSYNGSYFAVPRSTTSQVMYLNVEAFQKAGVDYPSEDWTWDDFRALAKELTIVGDDGTNEQWGFYFPKWNDGFYHFLRQNDGGLVSDDGKSSMLSQPESIEALQFLQDMILVDKSIPTESQAQQFGSDDSAVFIAGKAAMVVGGVAWMSSFNENNIDYVIVPLPTGKRQMDTSFVNAWTIPSGAKNPDLSWRVMEFFASKEGQQIVLEDNMGMPANKNVDTTAFLAAREDNHYFFDALDYSEPFPTPLYGVDFFSLVQQEFSLMWTGEETVEQAVANVEATGNDILAGNQP